MYAMFLTAISCGAAARRADRRQQGLGGNEPASTAAPARGQTDASRRCRSAAAAKADDDNFALPPGFKPKKRGKFTLYCRKEQAMGTRFPAQKCYDEKGIR